jgi:hypothetical protein
MSDDVLIDDNQLALPMLLERPPSFMIARDRDILPIMFHVHAPLAQDILDVTYNRGVMWNGSGWAPTVRADIDPERDVDWTGDCRELPSAWTKSFDVVAFDPPFLTRDQQKGRDKAMPTKWTNQYGLVDHMAEKPTDLFLPFLSEAKRVLRSGGFVFAKIRDMVSTAGYACNHVDFINAAREVGLYAEDIMIKVDPNAGHLNSPNWRRVLHFRGMHCYWIVVKKTLSNECLRIENGKKRGKS